MNIIDNLVFACDEIIEAETKRVTKHFHEKQCKLQNKKFQYFTFLFINYHCIVDSEKCSY